MRRWEIFALCGLVAAFALATLWGISGGLPHVTFPNETEQVYFALKFASGDLNPRLFVHPPLLAYLLCAIYGAAFVLGMLSGNFSGVADFERLFFTDPTLFYLLARVFTLSLAIASLLVFFRISRRFYGRVSVAMVATALFASSATHVIIAHYGAPDILMMFLSLLAFWPIIFILRGKGTLRHYVSAGLLTGLAVAAKYNAFCVGAALFLAHFLGFPWRTSPWRDALLNRNLSIGFGAIFVGFFLGCPYAILDFATFYRDFQQLRANAISPDYLFAHLRPQNPGLRQLVGFFLPAVLGTPLTIMCGVAVIHALWRRRPQDLLLTAYIVGYSAYIAPHNLVKPYYFVHIFPFLFLLVARTSVALTDRLAQARFRPALLACVFAFLGAHSWRHIITFDRLAAITPAMIQAKGWVEENVPAGTGVAVFEGMPLNPNSVSLDRQILETESRGLGAGVRLRRLRRHAGSMAPTYDVHEFPNPWRKDFLAAKFDYVALHRAGVQYVILNGDWERYLADTSRFSAQSGLHKRVIETCRKRAHFEQDVPDVDLGTLGPPAKGYVEVYECPRPNGA